MKYWGEREETDLTFGYGTKGNSVNRCETSFEKTVATMPVAKTMSAIILAGGTSRRMGYDKAELPFRGVTLLKWQIQKVQSIGIKDIIVTRTGENSPGVRYIPDATPGLGPLGGLQTCLPAADHADCLVIGVDLPLVSIRTLGSLLKAHSEACSDVTIIIHNGRIEPLIGVYRTGVSVAVSEQLKKEDHSVRGLLRCISSCYVECNDDENQFMNCNTQQEYSSLFL